MNSTMHAERKLRDLWSLAWEPSRHTRRDLESLWRLLDALDRSVLATAGRPATIADALLAAEKQGVERRLTDRIAAYLLDRDDDWCRAHALPVVLALQSLLVERSGQGTSVVEATLDDDSEGRAPRLPAKAIIELTGSCNLDCVMCGIGHDGYQEGRTMPLPRFREVASALFPTATQVRLNGLGESTAIPGFRRYLSELDGYSCQWELVTNLAIEDDSLWEELAERRFTLLVSCDGGSREPFESIRRRGRYDAFSRNLHLLAGIFERQDRRSGLHCIFTLMDRNIGELPRVVASMARARIGGVVVNVVKEEQAGAWLVTRRSEILAAFEDASRIATDGGLELRLPDHLGDAPVTGMQTSRSSWRACPVPWQEMVVRYDGDITPCNMMNPFLYGNLFETPFDDVWNGLAARMFRSGLAKSIRHPYCQGCYFLQG